jgi:predicted HicB family RNase H-like nuclease
LLVETLNALVAIQPDITVSQVKEKFGGLRFYYSFNSDQAENIVREAERRSTQICETCGAPGKLGARGGWWSTRCPADAPEGWEPLNDNND